MMNEQINQVLKDTLDLKNNQEIKPEHNLVEDLGADSLNVVEIVLGLETEFDIEILDEEADNVKTVQDVYNLVRDLA